MQSIVPEAIDLGRRHGTTRSGSLASVASVSSQLTFVLLADERTTFAKQLLDVKDDHSLRECDRLTQASEPRLLEENELAVREYGELGWHFRQTAGHPVTHHREEGESR